MHQFQSLIFNGFLSIWKAILAEVLVIHDRLGIGEVNGRDEIPNLGSAVFLGII